MNHKTTRMKSSGLMAALNHPMRVNLYNLIKEGAKTTPELAGILNENRLNLYHHLKILEEAGLIESYFGSDRLKKFRIMKINSSQLQAQFKKEIEKGEKESSSTLTATFSMVATPRDDNKKKFQSKVKELLELSGLSMDRNMEVIQVQMFFQPKNITKMKRKKMEFQQKMKAQKK